MERLEQGFEPGELALEYGLLRHSILRLLERAGHRLSFAELELLDETIDQGIMHAVTSYAHVRERMLQALERVSRAALESEDVDTFLPRLLQVLMEAAVAVDGASILLREGDRLHVRAAVGLGAKAALGMTSAIAIGEGITGKVAAERSRPFTALGVHGLAAGVRRHPQARHPRQLQHPLQHGNDLVGVAHMSSRTAFDFSESDKLLFRAMVTRATSFIVQAELAERERAARAEAQRSLAQLDTLLEASPVGVAFLDRELRYLRINETLATSMAIRWPTTWGRRSVRWCPVGWPTPSSPPSAGCWTRASRCPTTSSPARRAKAQARSASGWAATTRCAPRAARCWGWGAWWWTSPRRSRWRPSCAARASCASSSSAWWGMTCATPSTPSVPQPSCWTGPEELRRGGPPGGGAHSHQRGEDGADDQRHPRLRAQPQRQRRPAHAPRVGDLHDITRSALEELQVAHLGRRLELEVEGDGWGCWDADRMAQVVGNLVSNSLHHGRPDTPVRVKVRGLGPEVHLSVRNDGCPFRRKFKRRSSSPSGAAPRARRPPGAWAWGSSSSGRWRGPMGAT
jgi:PAS domain-containing protein